jgi:DNA recombination protein RmuC
VSWIVIVVSLAAGLALGLVVAFTLRWMQGKTGRELADELFRESEEQRKASMQTVIESVEGRFVKLSMDTLSKSTEEFLKLAKSRLDSERDLSAKELIEKKKLIDQQLKRMTEELDGIQRVVRELEKDREGKFKELAAQLKSAAEQTTALTQTTGRLQEALSSTKARGQWGERMAEDVLRLAGFVENVNYRKQKAVESGRRPDFTFLLPQDLTLNMDVKFPLDNYLKYLDADSDLEGERYCKAFLRDVRDRIKEVTGREYIDPGGNTVDYVLVFIPNEQVYAFIQERDRTLMDDALRSKVIFCSPLTLFAVLAVVRQAVENFALERTSDRILGLMGAFNKQWGMFVDKLEKMGKRIAHAQREFDQLTTTRRRQLEKPLREIETLRTQREIPVAEAGEPEPPALEGDGEIGVDEQEDEEPWEDSDVLERKGE